MEEENQNNEKIDILDFNKKVGFIMIPNVLFANLVKLNIKPYEYLLLSSLYYFAHQNDSAYPAQKTLEKLTGVTQRHIRRLFNSLIKKGYITKTRRRSKEKGDKSNIYSFKPLNNILERIITEDLKETQKNNNTPRTDCPPPTEQKSAPPRTDCPPKNMYLEEYIIKNTKLEEEIKDGADKSAQDSFDIEKSVLEILNYLNKKTNKTFSQKNNNNLQNIRARLKNGFTVIQLESVIDKKASEWLNNPKMNQYLNPETLFRPKKFEIYLNSNPSNIKEKQTKDDNKYKNQKITYFNPETGEYFVAGGE